MSQKFKPFFTVAALFLLLGFGLAFFHSSVSADTGLPASGYELADLDDYYKVQYDNYYTSWVLEEFIDISGSFLQYLFLCVLALCIPIQLLKSNILGEQQKTAVERLYHFLKKIHIPVAVVGIVGVIAHGMAAFFYENPFLSLRGFPFGFIFSNHFSGLIAAALLAAVAVTGVMRRKQKHVWTHFVLAFLFVIAYFIHG